VSETRIIRDYELRSEVSVVDVGARRYAADPSTEILCMSWRVKRAGAWGDPLVAIGVGGSDGRAAVENRVRAAGWRIATFDDYRRDFAEAEVVAAHNSGFEAAIEDYLLPDVAAMRLARWDTCTASRARRLSLPGGLEDACRVLRTPHQKSSDGHAVMLQCSQPRPTWVARKTGPKWFEDAERLAKTAVYCAQDILAECDLDDYLPELSPTERQYWLHTEHMNRRGVPLDVPLIDAMSAAVAYEQEHALARIAQITGDADFSLTNPAAIIEFCKKRGLWLTDLRKETVEATLRQHDDGARAIDEAAKLILELRRDIGGKSSVAKLPAMRRTVMSDSRTRDFAIYHQAHTGREQSERINLKNLPVPYNGFDQDKVIDFLMRGDLDALHRSQKVSASTAVSAALRGVIVPGAGKKLVVGDYKSIEPCFYFTLIRQWDVVGILARAESLYIDFGRSAYNRELDKKADLREYKTCKETVLGCGYGLGKTRFNSYLAMKGCVLPQDETDRLHEAYHRRFAVRGAWNGLEAAAKAAMRNPGTFYDYNGVQYVFDGWWLVCVLPTGRPFYYPNARLMPGRYDDEITYEGWMRIDGRPAGWGDVRTWGGKLLENVTQAVCRDIMEADQQEIERLDGWEMFLTVYDEMVASAPKDDPYAKDRMKLIMERRRDFMPEMPILSEIEEMPRYRK
jgi:DNA polymerase